MKKQLLCEICEYRKGKVSVSELNTHNYVSTENLVTNKGGLVESSGLPSTDKTQMFLKGDVLVSNIRPYFKKIWLATEDGGCSNDVLVFKAKQGVDERFLYYILADDNFFEFSTASSKGTKMPRGDKNAIMRYEIPDLEEEEQRKIGKILGDIDRKIIINNEINRNLSEQLKALFTEQFGKNIENVDSKTGTALGDLVEIIDNRGKTPPLSEDTLEFPIIDVGALRGEGRIIDFNNCKKFVSSDTYNTWFRSGHPIEWDILLSTVGSLAEMKLFMGEKGCIAQNVVALRSKEISPLYLYQYLTYIRNDLVAYNIGSVQPSIKVSHIINHPIYIPEAKRMNEFDAISRIVTNQLYKLYIESEDLKKIRDLLIPRLLSGELDVSELEI